ncbi:hypothetical protein T265_10028 [Opisthorchis viverrini]|uniref:Uncharacterized protein n=1 Tax=Opisthorchis viverrini TaxID=6198 RepID=A0A075A2X1_OPIVI|nr:hypothetical protein T265_10028 [Opisthorchis viverrini]KER21724.1 hypothetical protein T265_10028 [Opisthorchis viverrini]
MPQLDDLLVIQRFQTKSGRHFSVDHRVDRSSPGYRAKFDAELRRSNPMEARCPTNDNLTL